MQERFLSKRRPDEDSSKLSLFPCDACVRTAFVTSDLFQGHLVEGDELSNLHVYSREKMR